MAPAADRGAYGRKAGAAAPDDERRRDPPDDRGRPAQGAARARHGPDDLLAARRRHGPPSRRWGDQRGLGERVQRADLPGLLTVPEEFCWRRDAAAERRRVAEELPRRDRPLRQSI